MRIRGGGFCQNRQSSTAANCGCRPEIYVKGTNCINSRHLWSVKQRHFLQIVAANSGIRGGRKSAANCGQSNIWDWVGLNWTWIQINEQTFCRSLKGFHRFCLSNGKWGFCPTRVESWTEEPARSATDVSSPTTSSSTLTHPHKLTMQFISETISFHHRVWSERRRTGKGTAKFETGERERWTFILFFIFDDCEDKRMLSWRPECSPQVPCHPASRSPSMDSTALTAHRCAPQTCALLLKCEASSVIASTKAVYVTPLVGIVRNTTQVLFLPTRRHDVVAVYS